MTNNQHVNSNNSRSTNNRFSVPQNIKNYTKDFETFEEGYQELISLVPEVKVYGGSEPIYDSVVQKICTLISENVPSPQNSNYPNTLAVSITSRELGLKTDDKMAIGWRIFFNKESGSYTYQMRITFFSLSMSKKKYINLLEDNGWSQADPTRQGRFWSNIIRTDSYRNNSSRRNYISNSNLNSLASHLTEDQVEKLNKLNVQEVNDSAKESNDNDDNVDINENSIVEETTPIVEKNVENTVEVDNKYSITAGNTSDIFIVTHDNKTYVINLNNTSFPEGIIVDRANNAIVIYDKVYNYATLSVSDNTNQSDYAYAQQSTTNEQQRVEAQEVVIDSNDDPRFADINSKPQIIPLPDGVQPTVVHSEDTFK